MAWIVGYSQRHDGFVSPRTAAESHEYSGLQYALMAIAQSCRKYARAISRKERPSGPMEFRAAIVSASPRITARIRNKTLIFAAWRRSSGTSSRVLAKDAIAGMASCGDRSMRDHESKLIIRAAL